jgi:hypothetical protein
VTTGDHVTYRMDTLLAIRSKPLSICDQTVVLVGGFKQMSEIHEYTERQVFDRPAPYRICILGSMEESWSDYLGGLAVTSATGPDGAPITVLTGELADQVALSGVLQGLHRMGFTLLSAEKMDSEV